MRVRLKGINSITKKLADGTTRTYWYAWKGGPPLRGELGSPEFIASYNEAAARKVTPPLGKLLSLLQGYQASEDFTGLAASTRRSYVASDRAHRESVRGFPAGGANRPAHARYLQGMAGPASPPARGAGRRTTRGRYWRACCRGGSTEG